MKQKLIARLDQIETINKLVENSTFKITVDMAVTREAVTISKN